MHTYMYRTFIVTFVYVFTKRWNGSGYWQHCIFVYFVLCSCIQFFMWFILFQNKSNMDNELFDISRNLKLQLGYGIGHMLNDVCASLWFTYFLVFFHLVLGFSALQAGTLMLIGQVVDALATPFVGFCSDSTHNILSAKYGRRKLWHLFGTFCVLISFPFIFSECLGCSSTHKWAQMYYFAAFIMIFQIGWAAVQISHLSLIPELAEDESTRTHLTAIRYGFTVFSNLFVYIITWAVLKMTGECDTQQIGPGDVWKFKYIVYIVVSVGIIASIIFHTSIREKQPYMISNNEDNESYNLTRVNILKRPVLYQIAGIYMSSRLVVNVSQVLVPLYLHKTLGLAASALAIVPLVMYVGSLAAATMQRFMPESMQRKTSYFIGAMFALTSFVWIQFGSDYDYKKYFIHIVVAFIGFGGAIMLITSLALTADLVGNETHASAFVYGIMSFTDKLSCGIAIAAIQYFADKADPFYYRDVMTWVCGIAAVCGLGLTLTLPCRTNSVLLNENPAAETDEQLNEEN